MREPFQARRRHQIVLLDADSGAEFIAIKPRFCREHVPDLKGIVPVGIQTRRFVRGEADAVSEMVSKTPAAIAIEFLMDFLIDRLAADAGPNGRLDIS